MLCTAAATRCCNAAESRVKNAHFTRHQKVIPREKREFETETKGTVGGVESCGVRVRVRVRVRVTYPTRHPKCCKE
jgi:hypothetical protein